MDGFVGDGLMDGFDGHELMDEGPCARRKIDAFCEKGDL